MGLFLFTSVPADIPPIFSLGPMIHFNFGNHQYLITYSFEAAYWDDYKGWPLSLDFGVEYGRSRWIFYSEGQTGIGLTGFSWGPLIQFQNGIFLGTQSSVWINLIGGIDYRWRSINGIHYQCPGLYLKLPFDRNPFEHDSTSNNSSGENSSSIFHHHHHHFLGVDWSD